MTNQIRTYMAFSQPIDPARILTIPDMDLSYALGSTLVRWDDHKQIAPGIAQRWEIISEKTYRFTLRDGLKWSNNDLVKSIEVKQSIERGLKTYPDDHRSLANLIDRIECPDATHVDIITKTPAKDSGLLGKLTEPNYSLLKIKSDDQIDLKISSGAFALKSMNENEVVLVQNANWFKFSPDMAKEVIIRQPPITFDSQKGLLSDPWANMIETSSLIDADTQRAYEKSNYHIWKRPIDKVFLVRLSPKLENTDGFQLLRFLRDRLDKKVILNGLSGISAGDQVFPVSFHLHDPSYAVKTKEKSLPSSLGKRPLEVIYTPSRVPQNLVENFKKAITDAYGVAPKMIPVGLKESFVRREKSDFDLHLGTMGLADPDPEGIMSFYLENNPPVIPKGDGVFLTRLDEARKEKDFSKRVKIFRGIITDATLGGYILPVFHLSTVGIGKPELDFSQVSQSDESVTLSKVRFRKAQ
ncbi:MAG: hypothetical protein KA715_00300 [Xanthomonadaceae bacterium]|nr:hypothetical protein [Xanthomonadaceae bacterium]